MRTLKSNMDRFIDVINLLANYNTETLKSNMDRFIENRIHNLQFFKML